MRRLWSQPVRIRYFLRRPPLRPARENYEVIANRYANDLVLVTDLVDADNLRLAAEVQYVNVQINVIYNYCKLLYETGTLNAER